MDIYEESLRMHKEKRGKLEITSKITLQTKKDLSLAYTPGVAQPCIEISKDVNKTYDYTIKPNMVGVVTDGSAVLGLGNIGAEASLPVMEGKCILFKEFGGVDAFPICLKTQDPNEIIDIVKNIAPVFGGINLEDISAPRCFEIEAKLQDIGIPVFHDDQHGTAIVVLAGIINAMKVTGKKMQDLKVVINGSGAAGIAIAKMLLSDNEEIGTPVHDVIMIDSKEIIHKERTDLHTIKTEIAEFTNKANIRGLLQDAMKGADVFIGVSKANLVSEEMVASMSNDPIVLAMANPIPEIMPDLAAKAGAAVVGTGRSDFPNQINNVLAFPGIFRGALDAQATKITPEMKLAAARALADFVQEPTKDKILPNPLEKGIAQKIAEAVQQTAISQGVVRK